MSNLPVEPGNKENYFLIPGKITTRTEIFPGVGWIELAYIGAALAVGMFFYFLMGLPHKDVIDELQPSVSKAVPIIAMPIRMAVVLLFGSGMFMFVRKENGSSIMDAIRRKIAFSKSKKKYYFRSRWWN